jgi:hypothetical protein
LRLKYRDRTVLAGLAKIDSPGAGVVHKPADLANQIQAVLHLRPSNPKDFDRVGMQNIFNLCVRVESKRFWLSKIIFDLVRVRRLVC